MKRVWLIALLAAAAATLLIWWNWGPLVDVARRSAERELGNVFGLPARVRTLRVSLFPPEVHAEGIEAGVDAVVLRLDQLGVRFAALSSLAEGRPVITAKAKSLYVDMTALSANEESAPESRSLPPFRVGVINVDDLTVRFPIGDEVGQLYVEHSRGHGESALFRTLASGNFRLTGCKLSRRQETLDIDDVRIVAHADREGLTIESALLRGPGRSLEVDGESPTLHRLRLAVDLHDFVIFDDDFGHYRGSGTASGEIHGPLDAASISGTIKIDDLHAADRALGVLTTDVEHKGKTSRFENAVLRGDTGELRGRAVVSYGGTAPVEATLDWDVTSLERLLNKVDVALSFDNTLKAKSIVKGQFDPLDLDVSSEVVILAGAPVADLRVDSRIDRDGAAVEFSLRQADRTRIVGEVSVHGGVLDGLVEAETSDLSALATIAPRTVAALDLSGTARVTVAVEGATSEPRFEGTVNGGPLSVSGLWLEDLRGAFVWTETRLDLPRMELRTVMGGKASLTGRVALEDNVANSWKLQLDRMDTDLAVGIVRRLAEPPLVPEGGTVSGTVELGGEWKAPTWRSAIVADSVGVLGEAFPRIELNAAKLPSGWSLEVDAVHSSEMAARVSGKATSSTNAELSISVPPAELANVELAKRFGIDGVFGLEGRLTGDLLAPSGQFEASLSDLSVGAEEVGSVTMRARGRAGTWSFEGEAPARNLTAVATASTTPPFPYDARIEWQGLPFAVRAAETEQLHGTTSGVASFAGRIAAWRESKVALRVPHLTLRWDDVVVGVQTPVQLTGSEGRVVVEPFAVVGKDTTLTLAGFFDQRELAATVKGATSLAYLELFGDPIESAGGKIDLDVKLSKVEGRPWDAHGTAVVEHGVLDFGMPAAFTDAAGTIRLRGRVVQIEDLSAKSGVGLVRLGGEIDSEGRSRLMWHADRVALNLQPGFEVVIGGTGRVEGDLRELTVSGAVDVQSAVYSRDFEIVDIPALFAPRVQEVVGTVPSSVFRLDLDASSRGGLYVDNNVAQVEMSLDMRIRGTVREPKLIGSVGILGGEVKVRRRAFEIIGGAADFLGRVPPNPSLNINAETEVTTREADYLIAATVTGTARDPVVQFGSDDPTLTQTDIISLVTVGRTAAELQGESAGVSQIDALALVPTAPVEERVSELVGIDRFEIDLAQTNSQGDLTPGLTIGKSITEGFRAALTTTFDVDARNAVALEYDLTRRISLIGQWEADTESEAGAFGAGIRIRYEFRRIPLSLWSGPPQADGELDAD